MWSHQTFWPVYSVLPEAIHFKTLPRYRYVESPVQPFVIVIYYSGLVCECWNHSFVCPSCPTAELCLCHLKSPGPCARVASAIHSASWSRLYSPQPAHPSANNVLARQEHPWKASGASWQRCRHQIVPQGQGWKGQPACGCFSWNVTKNSCGAYSGKKGEELGAVVGYWIALYLFTWYTSFQLLVERWKAKQPFCSRRVVESILFRQGLSELAVPSTHSDVRLSLGWKTGPRKLNIWAANLCCIISTWAR